MKKILYLMFLALISCQSDFPKDLGNDYTLMVSDVDGFTLCIKESGMIIYTVRGEVLSYNFNSTFIIAEEKPFYKLLEETTARTPWKIDDEFATYKCRQYWIINKHQHKRYGPFTKSEYLEKKKELGVPDTLRLKPVNRD